jgi:hypothetical protein
MSDISEEQNKAHPLTGAPQPRRSHRQFMPQRIPGESEGDVERRGAIPWDRDPADSPMIEEGGTEWTPDSQGWPGDQPAQEDTLQERP